MTARHLSTLTCNALVCPEERIDRRHQKSVLSDPVDNQWLLGYYHSLPSPPFGTKRPFEDYRDAYIFGFKARSQNKAPYHEVHDILEEAWNDLIGPSVLDWEEAEPIVQYAYSRSRIRHPRSLRLDRRAVA